MITPLSTCQATPGVLCPVLVSTIQERHGQTGKYPKEGHEDDQTAGEPALFGKAQGIRTLLPGEAKAQRGTLSQYSSTYRAATESTEALSS